MTGMPSDSFSKIRNEMIKATILLFSSIFALAGCKANPNEPQKPVGDTSVVFTIKPGNEFQTIHGIGASDAWACQFVGKNWPDQKKNKIADLLFSTENDADGNPKGIGLSIWRFNVGAGSADQGDNSDIRDQWRRAEYFLGEGQSYDWSKQAGQRWFLQAAKERGVEDFIAFVNSPPVTLTRNRKAYSSSADQYNLPSENYGKYVSFLADVLSHFRDQEGISFSYISPFNEPQWDWTDAGQEGTPANNVEIAGIVRLLNTKLEEQNIDTKIEIPEAGKIDYLFDSSDKPKRDNQIEDFFSSQSQDYIGDLSHVAQKIAGHSYFSTWNFDHMKTVREQLVQKIGTVDPSLEYWMTEYCLLEDNSQIKGNGRDLGMGAALYTARVIHADLTIANAASWQWWTAISPYDYKDGLVYIDKNENNGEIYESKLLWVLGNYSRFIRPGMKRILVEPDKTEGSDIDFSAYKTDDAKQIVFVISNYKPIALDFKLNLPDSEKYSYKSYQTSAKTEDKLRLVKTGAMDDTISIPGNAVVTIVAERNN